MNHFISTHRYKYFFVLSLTYSIFINTPAALANKTCSSYQGLGVSLWTYTTNNTSLNIGIYSFRVTSKISSNLLEWKISSEFNNHYFDIERSQDGFQFSQIGRVVGSDNLTGYLTESIQNYQFTDSIPNEGLNYYRLKQVDFDGTFSYTNLKVVRYEALNKISLQTSPNPSTGKIQLFFEGMYYDDLAHIVIMDTQGKTIYNQMIKLKEPTLPINLPSDKNNGMYILTVELKGKIFRERIMIKK